MVFYWNQSDNKSPQVSRTLLSILGCLKNAVVRIVSTRPLLVTVHREPITIGTTVIFIFHNFFNSLASLLLLLLLHCSLQFFYSSASCSSFNRISWILQTIPTDRNSTVVGWSQFSIRFTILHIRIYQPIRSGRIWHKVNF